MYIKSIFYEEFNHSQSTTHPTKNNSVSIFRGSCSVSDPSINMALTQRAMFIELI